MPINFSFIMPKIFEKRAKYGSIKSKENMKTLLLLGVVLLTGCMSFNNAEVPVVTNKIPISKPVIEMKTGTFIQKLNGAGTSRGMISNKSISYNIINELLWEWKSNDLIKDYDVIGKLTAKPDYTLTINGSKNEDGPLIGAILTGMTFYLIPSSTTINFDLELELKNNQDGKTYKSKVQDSFTIWQSIIFLPIFPLYPVGAWNMHTDMSMYIYSEFYKQGAFSEFYKKESEVSQ